MRWGSCRPAASPGSRARTSSRCGGATTATASAAIRSTSWCRTPTASCMFEHTLPDRRFDVPRSRRRVPRREPDAARDVRSRRHRVGSRGSAAVGMAGELAHRLLSAAPRFRGAAEVATRPGGVRVRPRRGRRRARDSGRTGPRGNHRAGSLPLPGRRREGAAPRGAAGLRPQGHREAIRGDVRRPTGHRLAGRVSGDSTVAYAWAYAQALEAIADAPPPPRAALAARARARAGAHRQSPGRPRLSRQRRRLRVRPRAVLAAEGAGPAHEPRAVRPSARDGLRRAGRRRARPRAGGRGHDPRRMRDARARGPHAAATSTTSTTACRTASAPAAS